MKSSCIVCLKVQRLEVELVSRLSLSFGTGFAKESKSTMRLRSANQKGIYAFSITSAQQSVEISEFVISLPKIVNHS